MRSETMTQIYGLLGKAVLLPVPHKQKGCKRKGWPRTTWEQTQSREYQNSLEKSGNIGVLLGEPSANLVTIDCDSDEALEEFLRLNPELEQTLRTRGSRGGNVWLRMAGDYPSTKSFEWGEFRSHRSQTIIAGTHPTGINYRFEVMNAVLTADYGAIRWPEGTEGGEEGGSSSLSLHPSSPSPPSPPSPLYDIPSSEAIAAIQTFRIDHPHLYRLYDRLLAPLLPLKERSRNSDLTREIAPRLFGAMCERPAATVVTFLIDAEKLGGYPPEETRLKFESAWRALESSWPEKLSAAERRVFDAFQEPRCRQAFRICRELALNLSDEDFPPPIFYLSSESFATRLGLRSANGKPDSQTAWRILQRMVRDYRILHPIDRGQAHGHKQRGKAAVFAWTFPLPQSTSGE